MLGLNRPIIVASASHLAVSGRADSRDVVVDGILLRTAGKSARYTRKLVVPEPLDAVQRHLPF